MCNTREKLRILLVEDSEDDAFFFDLALQKLGWSCDRVHVVDGGQAVDYLKASDKSDTMPDLIFLDLKLPVLTGFEVLEWIAAENLQLHVVILSGSDHHSDIVRARELGATDYLVKPVCPEELKKRLEAVAQGNSVQNSKHPDKNFAT
jgi:DNA-binding response OmpR family regulator